MLITARSAMSPAVLGRFLIATLVVLSGAMAASCSKAGVQPAGGRRRGCWRRQCPGWPRWRTGSRWRRPVPVVTGHSVSKPMPVTIPAVGTAEPSGHGPGPGPGHWPAEQGALPRRPGSARRATRSSRWIPGHSRPPYGRRRPSSREIRRSPRTPRRSRPATRSSSTAGSSRATSTKRRRRPLLRSRRPLPQICHRSRTPV